MNRAPLRPGQARTASRATDAARRRALQGLWAWALASLLPQSQAGAQREEELADSVRTALSAAVAGHAPPGLSGLDDAQARESLRRWQAAIDGRLKIRLADSHARDEFLQTLWYEASRAGLEPALVLGLIEVESGFRKYAISPAGARGYMQVMPFWARTIGDGEPARLFHLQTNLRFGCVVLRHYLDLERGDLVMALGRYNGSRGQLPYPQLVLSARQRWLP